MNANGEVIFPMQFVPVPPIDVEVVVTEKEITDSSITLPNPDTAARIDMIIVNDDDDDDVL